MNALLQQMAALVASAAHEELLPRFNQVSATVKDDGSVVTEADLVMQARLSDELQQLRPEVAMLGEEMTEAEQQTALSRQRSGVWLLDPLDGTGNFANGFPVFVVSLALVRAGQIELGLVYDPQRRECFSAARGEGAWLNGEVLKAPQERLPMAKGLGLIDFKRLDQALAHRIIDEPPFASQRNMGAAALDWCNLAAGRGHVYLHGKQKLWDYAAGLLILEEAGGVATTLQGESVFNGSLEPRSAVAAVNPTIYRQWSDWLGIGAPG